MPHVGRQCACHAHRPAGLQAAALLLLMMIHLWAAGAARAASWPTIRAIEFSGNDVTRPLTMSRELLIRVGDPADPVMIERSRQAIQDLGLFRAVEASTTPRADGVTVRFTVHEKWRVLPLPRVSGNSNGEYGYGGQLKWNNLWGLNQTLNLQAMSQKYHDPDKTAQQSLQFGYGVPFLGDTRYGLSVSAGLINQASLDSQGRPYHESIDSAQVMGSYALSPEHPSKGWNVAGGLFWLRDAPSGAYAPTPISIGIGPVAAFTYDDLRYLIYSEEGQRFNATVQGTLDGVASTYTSSSISLAYRRDWHVGDTPHQDIEWLSGTSLYFGGAPGRHHDFFSLGGSRLLRGYSSAYLEGDAGYYLSAAYLRPVWRDWLRALVVVESGTAYTDPGHLGGKPQLLSIGVGLRIRVNWLVNTEIEVGAALPLIDNHSLRPFVGSVSQNR